MMNKIQFIEALKLRGIIDLNGKSIAQAMKDSGGEPSLEEMVKINENSMEYYIEKFRLLELKNIDLEKKIYELENNCKDLENCEELLYSLIGAGVDNWDGWDYAVEDMNLDFLKKMKISDLIKELEEAKKEYGDLYVFTLEHGFGGYSVSECGGIGIGALHPSSLEESGNEEELLEKYFPNNEDEITTIEIESGTFIYST